MEKKLQMEVGKLREEHPEAEIQIWAEDEHRIGLHPVNRRVWVAKGEQPIAQVNFKYQWSWVVGFVEPKTGETYWWIVPKLNHKVFSQVLAEFAQEYGINSKKRVILTIDGASFHRTSLVKVPEGIHLEFLPRITTSRKTMATNQRGNSKSVLQQPRRAGE